MRNKFPAIIIAGLLLAQLNPPGGYNLGMPQTPGARVPESNPGTAVIPPASVGPPAAPSSNAPAAPSGASAPGGPAYSFGAAPPPVVSPGR